MLLCVTLIIKYVNRELYFIELIIIRVVSEYIIRSRPILLEIRNCLTQNNLDLKVNM